MASIATTGCSGADPGQESTGTASEAYTGSGQACGPTSGPTQIAAGYNIMSNVYNGQGGNVCINWNAWNGPNNAWISGSTVHLNAPGSPAAYSAEYAGCHYGSCNGFNPLQVSSISSATTDWVISTNGASGTWDASFDVWFNKEYNAYQGYPDGLEIMIWEAQQNVSPCGSLQRSGINFGGNLYNRYQCVVNGTPVLSYVRTSGNASVYNFDLTAFFRDAQGAGYLQTSWYLQSVQAGFEIWNGGNNLTTNRFDVNIVSYGTTYH